MDNNEYKGLDPFILEDFDIFTNNNRKNIQIEKIQIE